MALRNEFIRRWEALYGSKYLFEPKDGIQLAAMFKKHPEVAALWPETVSRYLANSFWGEKRHPLHGLATRPGEFTGPAVVAGNGRDKTSGNVAAAAQWHHREVAK